ncbi:MAG: nucleotidyltransferase family protein [Saprospiraceae bacterium]|nr:nucleotidyltransferase family protein [Saprospiraceae bacterium]
MLTAIVLAAGMSRRMEGENKLLLPFGDKTMLETTLDHILAAGLEDIVVVLGHDSKRIQAILGDRSVKTVHNPDHPTGMTSSIQAGVRAALPHAAGFMICLSDMPLITSTIYSQLVKIFFEEARREPRIIVQPVFEGTPGNPVIFSAVFKNEILALEHPEGCKPVVQINRECVVRVPVSSDSILRDADTAADFEVLKRRF